MALTDTHTVGNLDHDPAAINPLQFLDENFSFYIEDGRREPRGDVLSDLAAVQYSDGFRPGGRRPRPHGHLLVRGRPGDHRQGPWRRDTHPVAGHQIYRFYPSTKGGLVAVDSNVFAGLDKTSGDSGACGINTALVIAMPFRVRW